MINQADINYSNNINDKVCDLSNINNQANNYYNMNYINNDLIHNNFNQNIININNQANNYIINNIDNSFPNNMNKNNSFNQNLNNNDYAQNIITTQNDVTNNLSQNSQNFDLIYNNNDQFNINTNNAGAYTSTIVLIFKFPTGQKTTLVMIAIETDQPFKKALKSLEEKMKATNATFNLDDFEFVCDNKLDLEKSVAGLGLQNNANIRAQCKPEKQFTLQFNVNGINENDNNIDNINNNIGEENKKQNACIEIPFYKNIKLKNLIDILIESYNFSGGFFWQQVKNGNLYIGNKAVSSDDYEKTVSEFLEWDNNDNRTDIKVNAVMQGVSSLYDIRERRFALQNDNEYFSAVACCPLETLSTVIERWCHANQFRSDKFINLMKSDQVKLIVGKYALGKEVLNSPIKDINGINLNETVLKMKLDIQGINLNNIKAKNFGMYFKVLDSEKEPCISNLNETQTLKEIIKSVGYALEDPSYAGNIVDQIEKDNLKIIGENNKEYVFNKDDLEKPFYKIIGNINDFAVAFDKNLPIIRFQIPTLEINQTNNNLINQDQINNVLSNNSIEDSSKIGNKQKKSSWLFKLLISLAIIFAVLSILAFALEFALALKIIFVVVAVICSIGLILSGLVNCCKKENPMGKNINGYGPKSEYYNNSIENINNLDGNYPQNQYQGQYPGENPNYY